MASKSKNKIVTFLLLALIAFLGFVLIKKSSPEVNKSTQEIKSNYPALYTSANLPIHPNAVVTDRGKQEESLEDGLRLTLASSDSVTSIASYFEKEMGELGWTIPSQKITIDDLYLGSYTKDDLYFQITISKLPDSEESKITIVFAKN